MRPCIAFGAGDRTSGDIPAPGTGGRSVRAGARSRRRSVERGQLRLRSREEAAHLCGFVRQGPFAPSLGAGKTEWLASGVSFPKTVIPALAGTLIGQCAAAAAATG